MYFVDVQAMLIFQCIRSLRVSDNPESLPALLLFCSEKYQSVDMTCYM